jgi:uncharacterized protein (TIGR00255 family)
MIKSMTGFGGRLDKDSCFGKISVELKSTNHKFLEAVLHLPDGFLSLDDKIRREIELRLKRGRIICVVNISGKQKENISINEAVLRKYIVSLKGVQKKFHLDNTVTLDTLVRLPGVLSVSEAEIDKDAIWPRIKKLLTAALDDLVRMRCREGLALEVILKKRAEELKQELEVLKTRFKKVMKVKAAGIDSDEERASFLKNADITEEIDRLEYHCKNLMHKLSQRTPVGKELDFIAQEMQREANTIGAKSCDTLISGNGVQMKSQIEKIREQVQNIE